MVQQYQHVPAPSIGAPSHGHEFYTAPSEQQTISGLDISNILSLDESTIETITTRVAEKILASIQPRLTAIEKSQSRLASTIANLEASNELVLQNASLNNKPSGLAEVEPESEYRSKKICTIDDLKDFERNIENDDTAYRRLYQHWTNTFGTHSVAAGKHLHINCVPNGFYSYICYSIFFHFILLGDGKKLAFKLADEMFGREFFLQLSWTGLTNDPLFPNGKEAMKNYPCTIALFREVIHNAE